MLCLIVGEVEEKNYYGSLKLGKMERKYGKAPPR
jgi:hypothetical protein